MRGQALRALVLMATLAGSPAGAETLAVPAAFPTLAAALAAAVPGDLVEVAPGTYAEHDLVLPGGVTVAGTGARPEDVVIDAGTNGRVFLAESLDHPATLRHLTLAGGRAFGPTSYDQSGGALLVNNCSLQILDCLFRGNAAEAHGGALRATNASLIIRDTRFESNRALAGGGGALDCSYGSSLLIRDCRFAGNSAAWGGAVSCRASSSPQIVDGIFTGNVAEGDLGFGGAVFADRESRPEFTRSTFYRNRARYGGALACFQASETNLQNCTLVENESEIEGGGLFTNDASPRIACSIVAYQIGTGVSARGAGQPVITGSDLYGNSGGDWVGTLAPQADADGNISADPGFCFTDPGQGFNLPPTSPCATAACGVMGAWPADCVTTPVTLGALEAGWIEGRARLSWRIHATDGSPAFILTGSSDRDPDLEWTVAHEDGGNGRYSGIDPRARRGAAERYIYRLYLRDGREGRSLLGEIGLDARPPFPGLENLYVAPNPFNPVTTIGFELGRSERVRVAVHGMDGRLVRVLESGILPAGNNRLVWDGKDDRGRPAASGPYLVLVETEQRTRTLKVTLLK